MIKEVHLCNWKSFGDAVFYIDPLTAVIGTNSSGKSNLLEALIFVRAFIDGRNSVEYILKNNFIRGDTHVFNHHENELCSIKIVMNGREEHSELVYKVELVKNSDKKTVVKREMVSLKISDGECRTLFKSENHDGRLKVFLHDNESIGFFGSSDGSLLDFFISQKHYSEECRLVFNTLQNIRFIDPLPNLMRGYSKVSNILESDASNIAGVLASFPDKEKAEIESRLSQYMSKIPEKDLVKVTAEKVGKLGKDAMLYCEENWNNQNEPTIIDASTMSDGTLRFLAIVATLLVSKEGSLILIEEVDNGLHPSRAEYLIKVLLELGREKKIDIVFTTHNPALLDALGTEMIPFISVVHRNPTTGNSEITLLEDIEQLPKLMASGSIGKLASQGKIEESLKHQNQVK